MNSHFITGWLFGSIIPVAKTNKATQTEEHMTTTTTTTRFVPTGTASSASDAPGYTGIVLPTKQSAGGPICWKCHGSGTTFGKRKRCRKTTISKDEDDKKAMTSIPTTTTSNTTNLATTTTTTIRKECAVCNGRGRMKPKSPCPAAAGKITRGRKGTIASTVLPDAYNNSLCCTADDVDVSTSIATTWGQLVRTTATLHRTEITIRENNTSRRPEWVPRATEELCNLVGHWRILQKIGSHRWTSDDLVTAAIASKELQVLRQNRKRKAIRYCDLGTGNGSVLQMVVHQALSLSSSNQNDDNMPNNNDVMLCSIFDTVIGIEARSEAVGLARRSLSFNVGSCNSSNSTPIQIVHDDFRTFCQECNTTDDDDNCTFDLITGTPPYFRVDFTVVNKNDNDDNDVDVNDPLSNNDTDTPVVTAATIRQGGMPTSMQSAPARCEFRGGIKEYCIAAASVLSGIFVVCENYQNHERAMQVFQDIRTKLRLQKLYMIEGKVNKGILFCVYVLQKIMPNEQHDNIPVVVTKKIAIRSDDGKWTNEYIDEILQYMSISPMS